MNEVSNVKNQQDVAVYNQSQNLNAHYTKNTKIELPKNAVAQGPQSMPEVHLFNDFDANERLSAINQDIFESTQKVTKPKKKKKILGLF